MTIPREVTKCLSANAAKKNLNLTTKINRFATTANMLTTKRTLTTKPVMTRLIDFSTLPHSLRKNLQKYPPIAGGLPLAGGTRDRGEIFKSPHTITSGLLSHGETKRIKTGAFSLLASMNKSSRQYPGLFCHSGTKR
jgi:hypothetical protein